MKHLYLILVICLFQTYLYGQSKFSVEEYYRYLKSHEDMSYDELLQEFNIGKFERYAKTNFDSAEFAKETIEKYQLKPDELAKIRDHGFVVSQRLYSPTFHAAYFNVFNNDLPVFITGDAILHSMHYSLNLILEEIETRKMFPYLSKILNSLYNELAKKDDPESIYYGLRDKSFNKPLRDLDVYLSVALTQLSGASKAPVFPENKELVDVLCGYIDQGASGNSTLSVYLKLFAEKERQIDFSQFQPKGHYTKTEELIKYFRTFIWLGRTELYFSSPEGFNGRGEKLDYSPDDLRRQTLLSVLITKGVKKLCEGEMYKADNFFTKILGPQDNATIWTVDSIMKQMKIADFKKLSDTTLLNQLKDKMAACVEAQQSYNSQIIYSDPLSLQQIKPAAAFMMIGQRAIIDGFIASNLVYDKIIYKKEKIKRILPNSLDVLFALGNDAALQLLRTELNNYFYSDNLAALKYLISGYDDSFWNSSVYTSWLKCIRSLNPPKDRSKLFPFQKTAAWQQKNLNSQLSSWAELRHDFILYTKQPYTAGILCSFPYSYVEPVPELFKNIQLFYKNFQDAVDDKYLSDFFEGCINTVAHLEILAVKEINNEAFSDEDTLFLKQMLRKHYDGGCNGTVKYSDGWFIQLFYKTECSDDDEGDYEVLGSECEKLKPDYIVADIHTAPTDEQGEEIGFVKHIGTGPINLAIIAVPDANGTLRVYSGAVSSFFEYTSINYDRLTDEEWADKVEYDLPRPNFTNLYMTDKNGYSKGIFPMLQVNSTAIEESKEKSKLLVYPNPAEDIVYIDISVPEISSKISLQICSLDGKILTQLFDDELSQGNFTYKWQIGESLSAGVYMVKAIIGGIDYYSKISVTR